MNHILLHLLDLVLRRSCSEADRYLSEATTLADLENRVRVIERHGFPTGHWSL